jgi:hypothetical protein
MHQFRLAQGVAHISKAMHQFFPQYPDRLTVPQLPAYASDLNPIEYLWRNIKKQAPHLSYFPIFANFNRRSMTGYATLPEPRSGSKTAGQLLSGFRH